MKFQILNINLQLLLMIRHTSFTGLEFSSLKKVIIATWSKLYWPDVAHVIDRK